MTVGTDTSVLGEIVDRLAPVDLRWLLGQVLACNTRVGRPEFVIPVVDALLVCTAEQGIPGTPGEYERWRRSQPQGEAWPSARLISTAVGESWAAALRVADLEVPWRNQIHSIRSRQGAFTEDQVLGALRECLEDTGQQTITYEAYREWALAQVVADRDRALPVKYHAFGKFFGHWDTALRAAGVDTTELRRVKRAAFGRRRHAEILEDLCRAQPDPPQRLRMTRGEYDRWAQKRRTQSPERTPASSHTVQKRFGTWNAALLASASYAGEE